MDSCGAVGFQQCAGGWAVDGGHDLVPRFSLDQCAESVQDRAAAKDATDVGYTGRLALIEYLVAHGGGERCKFAGSFVEDFARGYVTVFGCVIHQLCESCDAGSWELHRIEAVQQLVDIRSAGRVQQKWTEGDR